MRNPFIKNKTLTYIIFLLNGYTNGGTDRRTSPFSKLETNKGVGDICPLSALKFSADRPDVRHSMDA